ncbi:MAG TPA: aldehyde dehydrogenase family protein, partial [Gammaproteobacteria bacterium]|nr:aldehyde dehydrogenase family protein [Gammaproteobacteria bacterium]
MSLAILAQPAPSAGVAAFLRQPARLLIGGEWVSSASKVRIPVIDPATGAEVAAVADANAADVDKAVAAARAAFERGPWSTMVPAGREALLWRLADLIERNADELAELESIDNGKTKKMANIVDVPGARNYFRYMAGWATKIEGSTIDVSIGAPEGGRINAYTRRE